MLADRLRDALQAGGKAELLVGDLPEERAKATVDAAVLVAITNRAEPGVILTVRREHMRTHAGQIAFPGGRVDAGEDAVAAALREAHEEILLEAEAVDVVGSIEPYRTVTGYVVTPVIGVIPPDLPLFISQDSNDTEMTRFIRSKTDSLQITHLQVRETDSERQTER